MSAGYVRLPNAWRADRGEATAHRAEVRYDDLAAALDELAAAAGAGPTAVMVAAHVKVLGTLVEEAEFSTDVLWSGADTGEHGSAEHGPGEQGTGAHGPEVRSLTVRPGAARTWRDLVGLAAAAVRALPPAVAPKDGTAPLTDHVLFAADAADLGKPDEPDGPAHGHGLRVGVDGRTLVLRADGHLSAADLDRLAVMYRRVLEAMAAAPEGDAVAAVLPDGERHAVLRRWALGRSVPREPVGVLGLFRRQAARTPDAPAVRADGRTLGYRELDLRSNRVARRLLDRGVRPGTLVGVCLRHGADLLPTLLGVWKTGAAYLPLDPDLPAQRLRAMVAAAGCPLVVTRSEHRPLFAPADPAGSGAEGTAAPDGGPGGVLDDGAFVLLDREHAVIDALPSDLVDVPSGPADLAYVIYTSGSTGAPKGVMVHHAGLANYVLWTALEYAARGTGGSPHFSSIGFDLGVPSLYTPLVVGQRVDLLPDPLDPADLGALLVDGAPYSFIKMTPGHLNLLSTDLEPEEAHGLAGLVIAAGDAFPTELARRWQELAGPGGTPVATEYGPTEITVGNSGQVTTELPADGLVPLGRPIPNTTMYVLDDRLEPVPEGVPGEVYVGGAGVARGYLGAPALTAERFVPDPYGPPGSRLYRTGDRGRWRRGELEFLGRTDHQVKIRGYRVEPGEIRAVLQRRPEIGEAVVIAVPGPSGAQRLAAFLVPAEGAGDGTPGGVGGVDVARVRADLAGDLPAYMVPAEFRVVGEIPLTANGKVDTRALQAGL
ncbi:amino acid adenylation domain-containing protein [Kitasatospora sp. NBC_00458]|uniref:amino acid adenylation domain-containing protein n=1 Tax=Kitasatospora sp. NBC_00458 TaxID=2903568 RepID=UPI002E1734E5